MSVRRTYAAIARTYRSQVGTLLATAVLVFLPLGFVEALDHTLEEVDTDALGDIAIVGLALGVLLHTLGALFAEVLYTGIVFAQVERARGGRDRTMGQLLRTLPFGRLIAVDVVLALVVSIGVLLLVAPGAALLTWFALAVPAVEAEDRGVRAAFARSRQLVLGHSWRVAAVILPLVLASDALATAAQSGALWEVGDTFVGDWIGATLAEVIVAPFYALGVAILYQQLVRPQAPGPPAAA